jgi:hypothetical protein
MAKKELIDFIDENLKKGYDINTIKSHLLGVGYDPKEIDAAIEREYTGRQQSLHMPEFSKTTLIAITCILLSLILIAYVSHYLITQPKTSAKLLYLETKAVTKNVNPGGVFQFEVDVRGQAVQLRHEMIDTSNKLITRKEEPHRGGIKTAFIIIPKDTRAGNYVLKTTASGGGKEATAKLSFKVYEGKKESCSDGVKNQGEMGIDCGGPCKPCTSCSDGEQNQGEDGVDCGGPCEPCKEECKECSDGNKCTQDLCNAATNYKCAFRDIVPCCGNNKCEPSESYVSCPADCEMSLPKKEKQSAKEVIEQVKRLSKTDVNKAGMLCDTLEKDKDKDRCFSEIAKDTNSSTFCNYINSDSKKDTCYMNFAMDGDYSVCDKVTNPYLKKSCESLRYISEIEQPEVS